ncbi:conserved hypothetical protein [Ricinus communis]|uniref:Shikimate kinase n=1 Tax=Ricinus communis TaxID=3988 RepID=B9TD63_RICCO|nr:conserved hypothetical protein [Ricinus communis]
MVTASNYLAFSNIFLVRISDEYVEQTAGGNSVSHIFQQYGEDYFRDIESEALQKLSIIPRQVVATGGGSVVRPINWKYMRQGITVFLDVPLDALARRIAAVGTDSRPLLHLDSGDPYTKAFMGLFTLSKKRVEAYSDADVTVSLLDSCSFVRTAGDPSLEGFCLLAGPPCTHFLLSVTAS